MWLMEKDFESNSWWQIIVILGTLEGSHRDEEIEILTYIINYALHLDFQDTKEKLYVVDGEGERFWVGKVNKLSKWDKY